MTVPTHPTEARRGGGAVRPLLAAAFGAAVMAATAGAASAETLTAPDPAGDVASAGADEAVVAVPERSENDVRRTTLRHGARTLSVRVAFHDLQRRGADFQGLFVTVVTDEGVRRHVGLNAWQGHRSGESEMYGNGGGSRCEVEHAIDYAEDVMEVRIPRRCVGDPRWVRFRVGAHAQEGDRFYGDDALRDRPLDVEDENWKLSGRLHRGTAG